MSDTNYVLDRIDGDSSTIYIVIEDKPINFYLKFEAWNPKSLKYEPLPKGIFIDVMSWNSILMNKKLASKPLDKKGCVHFEFENEELPSKSDIFFLVHTNSAEWSGLTFPKEWSTKGWTATNGSPGFYQKFAGKRIGADSAPATFRVGVDYHMQLAYKNRNKNDAEGPAPKGIQVELIHSKQTNVHKARSDESFEGQQRLAQPLYLVTDDHGEIHGVTFDIKPDELMSLHIYNEIEDKSINLPLARVKLPAWSTDLEFQGKNSIGTPSKPLKFCSQGDSAAALYILKTLREFSVFLYYMTGGASGKAYAWKGMEGLTYHLSSAGDTPYSWPVRDVYMSSDPSFQWDRCIIVHETAHQVMWKEVNYSSLGIAYKITTLELRLAHTYSLLANPSHALIEGWAELFEKLFFSGSTGTRACDVTRLRTINLQEAIHRTSNPVQTPLHKMPNNTGESVEGAMANGLLGIMQNIVSIKEIPESQNGDITSNTPQILDINVQEIFQKTIWKPFKSLKDHSEPTSTIMLKAISDQNENLWQEIHQEFWAWNMAMPSSSEISPPKILSISPRRGHAYTKVTIIGNSFSVGTNVFFGQEQSDNIKVLNSKTLEAEIPKVEQGAKLVNITVESFGQKVVLGEGFLYE